MHTVDNGVLKFGMYQVLRTGFEKKKEAWKYVTARLAPTIRRIYKRSVTRVFRIFRKCQPSDYARQPRDPFIAAGSYKTAESRLAGTRYLPALFHVPEVNKHFHNPLSSNYMNLVIFCRLIGHFSTKPLHDVSFESYLRNPYTQSDEYEVFLIFFLHFIGSASPCPGAPDFLPEVLHQKGRLAHVSTASAFCNPRCRGRKKYEMRCRPLQRIRF